MTKRKYLKQLARSLKGVPAREREDLLSYYDELIEDRLEQGRSPRDVFSELEPPETVAQTYLRERAAEGEKGDGRARNVRRGAGAHVGSVVLAVLASVFLGLLLAVCAVAAAGMAIAAVYVLIVSFGLIGTGHAVLFFAQWGMAFALFALAILSEQAAVLLARACGGMWRAVSGGAARKPSHRGTRRTLIAGGAVLLGGCLLFTAAFGSLGFDGKNLAVTEGLAVREQLLDISDALVLQVDNSAVTVRRSEEETCKLVYREFSESPKDFSFRNGTAVLGSESGFGTVMGASFGLQWRHGLFVGAVAGDLQEAELVLPASFAGDLTVQIRNGALSVADMVCSDLTVETTNGAISLKNVTAETVTAETVNGAIRLDNVACARVRSSATNGAIRLERLAADNISLHTTNGAATGTLTGAEAEYSIAASCRVGACNLQDRAGGSKRLEVRVGNGAVNIGFLG